MVWNKTSEVGFPTEEKQYLCYIEFEGRTGGRYDILDFAKNLYKIDKYDFHNKKNVAGFYCYDSEWGYSHEEPKYWADFDRVD